MIYYPGSKENIAKYFQAEYVKLLAASLSSAKIFNNNLTFQYLTLVCWIDEFYF